MFFTSACKIGRRSDADIALKKIFTEICQSAAKKFNNEMHKQLISWKLKGSSDTSSTSNTVSSIDARVNCFKKATGAVILPGEFFPIATSTSKDRHAAYMEQVKLEAAANADKEERRSAAKENKRKKKSSSSAGSTTGNPSFSDESNDGLLTGTTGSGPTAATPALVVSSSMSSTLLQYQYDSLHLPLLPSSSPHRRITTDDAAGCSTS